MASTDEMSNEELNLLATEWRRRALQGDLSARGTAHEFEAELRRRSGAVFTSYDTLDLRSLESRQHHPWWRFWRKRTGAGARIQGVGQRDVAFSPSPTASSPD